MRIFFGLLGIGLVFAAISGAALSWDGSVYLLHILDTHTPFVPHDRYVNVLLHTPVLILSNVTNNIGVLQAVLGLSYAAVPLASLAICWWIVRQQDRTLFVWPVLGLGLGILPGLFNMVAEANIAIFLFWPILLAILTGMQRRHLLVVGLLILLVALSHPNASVLFLFAAATTFILGWRDTADRRRQWVWMAGFAVIAVLMLVRLFTRGQQYERDQATIGNFLWSFGVSVAGLPLVALVAAGIAALVLLLSPRLEQRDPRFVTALPVVASVAIVVAGLTMLLWARDPHQWMLANRYTLWAPLISIVFMSLAVVERLWTLSARPVQSERTWSQRVRLTQLIAGVSLVTLTVQSTAWAGMTTRLRETLTESQWNCLSMAPIEWIRTTPLAQFGTPALSLLLQGRQPTKVMLSGDECGTQDFRAGLSLDQYAVRPWNNQGWFDLSVLNERVVGEQTQAQSCSWTLTSGWYETESNGPYWWRWSDGEDAQIRVLAPKQVDVVLSGQIESVADPNQIAVFINDQQQPSIDVTWDGLQTFKLPRVQLQQGNNTIRFVSQSQPIETQGRMLGLGVANLVMTTGDTDVNCVRHP